MMSEVFEFKLINIRRSDTVTWKSASLAGGPLLLLFFSFFPFIYDDSRHLNLN